MMAVEQYAHVMVLSQIWIVDQFNVIIILVHILPNVWNGKLTHCLYRNLQIVVQNQNAKTMAHVRLREFVFQIIN